MRSRHLGFYLLATLALASLSGCADIEVLPADESVSEREGIVYYPQRPYVVVKQEFPVEGDEGFLVGTFRSGFVTLRLNELLAQRFGQGTLAIPASAIRVAEAAGRPPDGGGDASKPSGAGELVGDVVEPDEASSPPGSKTTETRKAYSKATGTMTWDPSVPTQVDVSTLFKVVYLPDLDEKRVISANAGIGTADMTIALGPGDTINRFQTTIDNSAIGEFLFDTIRDSFEIAKELLKKKLTGGLVSGLEEKEKKLREGQELVLKYTYVGHATPGVYPILKAKEYQQAVARAGITDPLLIPAEYPYTRMAFKVRRTLVLEAADFRSVAAGAEPGGTEEGGTRGLSAVAKKLNEELRDQSCPFPPEGPLAGVRATFKEAKVDETDGSLNLFFEIPAEIDADRQAITETIRSWLGKTEDEAGPELSPELLESLREGEAWDVKIQNP